MSNLTIIATGYRSKVNYNTETGYGNIPISATYKWFGAVQNITATVDQNEIQVWRLDGGTRFPSFILQGARTIDTAVTYFPQDINLLQDMVNNVVSQSHTIAINYTDINQGVLINGAVANTVRFVGRTGEALEVTVGYYAQNVSTSISAAGITFATDPGNAPFYFTGQSVTFGGTTLTRVLSFDATVTNDLERVWMFGQAYIRALPRKTGQITGTITATFADMTDVNNVMNLSGSQLVINLGVDANQVTRSLSISSAYFVMSQIPSAPKDLIALTLDFVGEGVFVS